jgi:hypothetical protein
MGDLSLFLLIYRSNGSAEKDLAGRKVYGVNQIPTASKAERPGTKEYS